MKILFVCGAGTVSGREIATLNLIRGLRERGHDVHCVASTWGDGKLAERLEAQAVPHVSLPLGFISKTLSWSAVWMTLDQLRRVPRLWLGFRRYLREFKPEVVAHTNFHHLVLLWPLLNPRSTFFQVHDDFPQTGFYRRLFSFLNRRICAFICVSRYIASSIVRLGIPSEKVCTVYNGVAVEESSNENEESAASEIKGRAAPGTVVIGIVGQIGEWKGHDDLVLALRELKTAGLSFSCVIFGDGEAQYVDALTKKIADYDLTCQVRRAGFVKSLKAIYAAIDICVVPSRVQEAFGMVAAEAAYFGVPVIATRLGALTEIVQDGETGFVVDAEAPAQLAAKLRVLIEDAALRRRMGEAARDFARRQFMQNRLAQQVEDTFIQALKSRSSAAAVIETAA